MHKLTPIPSILTILAIGFSSGCGSGSPKAPVEPQPIRLRVAAASDLQPWLGPALEQWGLTRKPGSTTETIYGSSHQLAAQIRAGAPIDLFLSADLDAVTSVSQIDGGSIRPYAVGRIAILARKSLGIKGIDDLRNASFRNLAIASPETAPYGRAAKSALVSRNLWNELETRIVVTSSVRQAFQSVVDGNAEAGFVSLGHAKTVAANPDLVTIEIPQELHPPIVQYLGIVQSATAATSRPDERYRAAEALSDWLVGPETDDLFRSHALERPEVAGAVKVPENRSRPVER